MKQIEIGFEMYTEELDKKIDELVKVGGGDPVVIEFNHTFIGGTTGTGKSVAFQRLIEEAEKAGKRVLIIDAKRKRDYAGFNADIPLYIKQQMEPIVIKDSIETTERFTVKQQFGTLLDTVAESETWQEMLEVIKSEMKTASTWIKKDLKILQYFIRRLVKEYDRFQWSDTLKLNKGISVMDISKMGIQMQQLVVGSAINYIQDNLTDITVILDEAHRFVPQGQTSGCSRDIVTYIREGRASENWMWLADQTVTGISKDLLKQMQYWILGRQSELNEAQRTVKQIPRAKSLGVNIEEIQTLGLGKFLVVCPEWAKKTYIWPLWISRDVAINVALGKMTAKQVARQEKSKTKDDDEMWKQQFLDEQKARVKAEKKLDEFKKKLGDNIPKGSSAEDQLKIKRLEEKIRSIETDDLSRENAKETIMKLKDDAHKLALETVDLEKENTKMDELMTKLEKVRASLEDKTIELAAERQRIKLLQGELEFKTKGSQAFENLRKVLGSPPINYKARIEHEVYDRLKAEVTREVIAQVGTGTITVTEDIDLGKIYQENAYQAIIGMFNGFDEDTIKILGFLLHIDKGVVIKEITWAVYHKKSKRELGRASPAFDERLAVLKKEGLTEERGGRLFSKIDDLVEDRMTTVGASEDEIENVISKIKGHIAKRLRGDVGVG